MPALAKPFAIAIAFALPRLHVNWTARRQRRATIDLIHASPHLLRDIGVEPRDVIHRGR